ncbi:FAD-dependent monooxygenase [Sphaerisporangium corydalis]|uniref:FAD-dependent monooxygenase n=1 Tax=Sphaerisporangium corydalis TaxID=1441875 RepID=A0ABV9ER08_9ACTN|nr:FAD-dependent monooxygenase [Sphaerisporangium corydalis]
MKNNSVLISGAGVAGPALAHWLWRYGFTPTVVELAAAPRAGGAAIDVRGSAIGVLESMGILDEVRRHRTRMGEGVLVDATGHEFAKLPAAAFGGELEILKEDLTRVLYTATERDVEYLFGDSIIALDQDADGVRVTFAQGGRRTFDLVVGADGMHSATRRLAFDPAAVRLHHLGIYGALFTTPNFLGLEHSSRLYNAPGKMGYVFTARGDTETRVGLSFASGPLEYDRHDEAAQARIVEERFAGDGWEIPRLLEAMRRAPDFYFDSSGQVHLDRWSAGRVTLVGDAGYCAAPTSGRGTSQALIGAYVLAGELAEAGGDHEKAFAAYEAGLRDHVEANQKLGRDAAVTLFEPLTQEMIDAMAGAPTEDAPESLPLKDYAALATR